MPTPALTNDHKGRVNATGSAMPPIAPPSEISRAGWTVKDWCNQISISPAFFYELRAKGLIETVKVFNKTIVTTPPTEFLAGFKRRGAK